MLPKFWRAANKLKCRAALRRPCRKDVSDTLALQPETEL